METTIQAPARALRTSTDAVCHSCESDNVLIFYGTPPVPVHSVLLLQKQSMALGYRRRALSLGHCSDCGFIFNTTFDPTIHEYSSRYEETQGFSPTFQSFHRNLALKLIDRFGLRGKKIIEIGCGKGEFLTLLCELGGNYGLGFDPSYIEERNHSQARRRMEFIADFYSEKYAFYEADFFCCKMTLEHIQPVRDFVCTVRRSVGERRDTIVFFQVPNATKILDDVAFWDIYYEHCSYFTDASLCRLFQNCGFEVLEVEREYDEQYLTVVAVPSGSQAHVPRIDENTQSVTGPADVMRFAVLCRARLEAWRKLLDGFRRAKARVVVWGGGSKAVAFLTTLNVPRAVRYAVDVNPFRVGTFLAGGGEEIVAPEFLKAYRPDVVIIMNPIYQNEICAQLSGMGIHPQVMTVESSV
jgi:hypothetical protein